MIEIEKRHYKILKSILKDIETTPTFVLAVIDGFIDGMILTDSGCNDSYLVGTNNGIYFVFGDPNKSFIDQLQNYYNNRHSDRFTLFTSSDEWKDIIESIVTSDSKVMKRKLFTLNQSEFLSTATLANKDINNYEVVPVNKDTVEKSDIFNQQYYLNNWGCLEEYLKHGVGFCAINEKEEVVSECTSIFRSKSKAEIDIYTNKNARGNGLALKLASVFIYQCLKQNILPSWDCDVSNSSSLHLAEVLQFDRGIEYTMFYR